jgi:hypothetical protein
MKPNFFKIVILFLLISVFLIPIPVKGISLENPLKAKTFAELINNIIDIIFTLALAIAPVMIIIAGLLFVTSAGSPGQIETAKKIILYTLIGFVIVLMAKGFINLFTQYLGKKP